MSVILSSTRQCTGLQRTKLNTGCKLTNGEKRYIGLADAFATKHSAISNAYIRLESYGVRLYVEDHSLWYPTTQVIGTRQSVTVCAKT